MRPLIDRLHVRPRLYVAVSIGIIVFALLPSVEHLVTRALIGWNATVWPYIALVWLSMWQADHHHLRRVAQAQAEGAAVVLGVATAAAAASILAIVAELSLAKGGARYAIPHVLFALFTVVGSWLLLPTLFALNYASLYHGNRDEPGAGLLFPGTDKSFQPDYWDFMYFSVTIAVASQTADVAITSPRLRRLVLLQEILSFGFNTSILALSINIAAGLL